MLSNIAQKYLKENGIICINRDKIPYWKINAWAFGKTGTLITSTEDHLNIAGFLPHHNDDSDSEISSNKSHNIFIFGEYIDSIKSLSNENF